MSVEFTAFRSSNAGDQESAVANRGDLVFDNGVLRVEHENYYAACGGQVLSLPRKEFLILSRLALNPERVVPAEELWRYAWGRNSTLNAESLHVHIYRLRRRLEPADVHLETMINVGYRLTFPKDSDRPL